MNGMNVNPSSPPSLPEQLLNNFLNPPDFLGIDKIVSDAKSVDTPLVSPFLDSDDDSDDGFRQFVAYFDPNLSMKIITRKALNTIMVNQLSSRDDNFVGIVRNVHMYAGSFTYMMDFTIFKDIGTYIASVLSKVVMGKPFKDLIHLEDDYCKDSFLRLYNPKWREKVTEIEESKDLSLLALDELIGNLKVHEVVMEKDSKIYSSKKERVKSIAFKAKKESSDDETLTSGSDDEEYAMAKGKSDQKCFRCGDPNNLIGDCPKPPRNKDQKAFIRGSWSDSENEAEDKTNVETCLMAQLSNEVTLNSSYYSDNASSLDNDTMQIEYDSLCEISLKIINKNNI
ncbi:hypothetical protein Tco_1008275 [Tanacetum coccineum]